MPLPWTLSKWDNIRMCRTESNRQEAQQRQTALPPSSKEVLCKWETATSTFYIGWTFIGLLSQDQRGSSIKATTTSIVVTWPPIKRSNMTGWMAATSAGEEKKKTNSVIFREYCMDLVSLETQRENDYIQNWLDSRNLTYTWTSGRYSLHSILPNFHLFDANIATLDPQFLRQALWLWRLWPTRLAADQCEGVVLDWVQQEDCTNQPNQWGVRYEWELWRTNLFSCRWDYKHSQLNANIKANVKQRRKKQETNHQRFVKHVINSSKYINRHFISLHCMMMSA